MRLESRRAHRRIWLVLGVLLPTIVFIALVMKQETPVGSSPVLLEAPEAS